MHNYTDGSQNALIRRAKEAPSYGDLLDIISDLDDKLTQTCEERDDGFTDRDEKIADLERELEQAKRAAG